MSQKITLIAAYAAHRCIGLNNTIPWHVPEDFAFFKEYTGGKPVVMGRKTWESLPRKPLPNRRNIVISRNGQYQAEGAEVVESLQAAVELCREAEEIIIMGGAQIYEQAMPLATDLRITEIGLDVEGDAVFPEITADWIEQARENHESIRKVPYSFVHYVRK